MEDLNAPGETAVHEIEPYVETPIPDTGLIAYHQGDEEGYVHVEPDGSIKLCGPWDWFIRVAKS